MERKSYKANNPEGGKCTTNQTTQRGANAQQIKRTW